MQGHQQFPRLDANSPVARSKGRRESGEKRQKRRERREREGEGGKKAGRRERVGQMDTHTELEEVTQSQRERKEKLEAERRGRREWQRECQGGQKSGSDTKAAPSHFFFP